MTSRSTEAPAHPLFLRLEGRTVLVVGGGPVATQKAQALHVAGARIRVVAPAIEAELATVASWVHRRTFEPSDLDGAWLAVAAAPALVNQAVKGAADARQVFLVAVDDIANCSAFGAAQLHRGGLTLAISSDGRAPALVALLRQALDALVPDGEEAAAWVAIAERSRQLWKAAGTPFKERRPLLLSALNALYERREAS